MRCALLCFQRDRAVSWNAASVFRDPDDLSAASLPWRREGSAGAEAAYFPCDRLACGPVQFLFLLHARMDDCGLCTGAGHRENARRTGDPKCRRWHRRSGANTSQELRKLDSGGTPQAPAVSWLCRRGNDGSRCGADPDSGAVSKRSEKCHIVWLASFL